MRIAWLEGDGIGPEIMDACHQVLQKADSIYQLGLEYHPLEIGLNALQNRGTTLPENVIEQARNSDGIVLGPVSHLEYPERALGGINPSGELRTQLDLFANLRPAFTRPHVRSFADHQFDLLIVRENTEGFYADRNMHLGPGEYMPTPDLALATRKISRQACLRIARVAFEQAEKRRGQVTAVHKANVLKVSDGLFLQCTRRLAEEFPNVAYGEQIVDAMAAHLIRKPDAFDVIVTTNMYGDILSDQATEMAGGLGLAASLNVGTNHAMAQAQHGSAPDIAGQGVANPVSIIASTAMLLNWFSDRNADQIFRQAANAINMALESALASPELCTPDLGGHKSTKEFSACIVEHLANHTTEPD